MDYSKKVKKMKIKLLKKFCHQDWIRYGIRNFILSKICNPNSITSYKYDINFFGHKLSGNLMSYIEWKIYFFGAYEKQILFLLRDTISNKKNPIFIDVGANIGQHSIFMSEYCKQIHSFEPFPKLFSSFKKHVKRNNIENISISNVGLGSEEKYLDFYPPKDRNLGIGSFIPHNELNNSQSTKKLKVIKGDNYIEKKDVEKVDLIKIDVEGFEKNVLDGFYKTLTRFRPVILMEFSNETKSRFKDKETLKKCFPYDFKIYEVETNVPYFIFFNKPIYRLNNFEFYSEKRSNILIIPEDTNLNLIN